MSFNVGFIVGAGGSIPYGLPSGLELYNSIAKIKNDTSFRIFIEHYYPPFDRFELLSDRVLKANNPTIDTFLEMNQEFEEECKLCISFLIKLYEYNNYENLNKNEWLRSLFGLITKKIRRGMDPIQFIHDLKIYFLTFNYDRLIEHFFLSSIFNAYKKYAEKDKIKENDLDSLSMKIGIEIDHVYGKLGDFYLNPIDSFNEGTIKTYSKDIRTIGENIENIEKIRERLDMCEKIFILGYGFDQRNNELLMLDTLSSIRRIYATCKDINDTRRIEITKQIKSPYLNKLVLEEKEVDGNTFIEKYASIIIPG